MHINMYVYTHINIGSYEIKYVCLYVYEHSCIAERCEKLTEYTSQIAWTVKACGKAVSQCKFNFWIKVYLILRIRVYSAPYGWTGQNWIDFYTKFPFVHKMLLIEHL